MCVWCVWIGLWYGWGNDMPYSVIDGQRKYEVVSIKADSVVVSGFKVIDSGYGSLNDPCGIKIYDKKSCLHIRNTTQVNDKCTYELYCCYYHYS